MMTPNFKAFLYLLAGALLLAAYLALVFCDKAPADGLVIFIGQALMGIYHVAIKPE